MLDTALFAEMAENGKKVVKVFVPAGVKVNIVKVKPGNVAPWPMPNAQRPRKPQGVRPAKTMAAPFPAGFFGFARPMGRGNGRMPTPKG